MLDYACGLSVPEESIEIKDMEHREYCWEAMELLGGRAWWKVLRSSRLEVFPV
jgi:hypothetical protein